MREARFSIARCRGSTAFFSLTPPPAPLTRIGIAARRCLGAGLIALAALAIATAPGEAQSRSAGTAAARDKKDDRKATAQPSGPLLAVVSIARQRIQVYDGTGVVAHAPVSTGMAGYRTPTGVFSILQRSRFHRSNIYSNAPMPYMQRLTWSGVALHAGVLPGYPASHGCIRLPHRFAVELWGMTRLGTRVVVAPEDAVPVEIEHPRLPAPRPAPTPTPGGSEPEGVEAYGAGVTASVGLKVADAEGRFAPPHTRAADPFRRAVAAKAKAAADVAAATKAAKRAAEAAAASAADARSAAAALRNAESALAAAQRRREQAARVAAAALPAAAEGTGAALAAAEDALAQAKRVADEAWLVDAALGQEAFEAALAATDAQEARRGAAAANKAAEHALEPISIFVSRKAGRVYIRQAWVPVHEAPIAFAADAPPLGTHLYLAIGAEPKVGRMRWLSVSLPASPTQRRPRPRHAPDPVAPMPGHLPETAASVLDRFELPAETRRFIEERLWAGVSLIVSDRAGSETGTHTDFIVSTR